MFNRIYQLITMLTLLMFAASSFAAGFGDMFKSLQQGNMPAATFGQLPGQPASSEKQGQPSFGAKVTENYCRSLFSVAAIEQRGPISDTLVSEEFNFEAKDFFDEFEKSRDAKTAFKSYTFPTPNLYQGEFETEKINVLFDMLLSYPSDLAPVIRTS